MNFFSFDPSLLFLAQAGVEAVGSAADGGDGGGSLSPAMQVWYFLRAGGFFMIFIGLCSLVAVGVVAHRAISLRRKNVIPPALEEELWQIEDRVRGHDTERLGEMLSEDDSSLGDVARTALGGDYDDRDEAANAVESTAREEVIKLQTGLAVLEVVITIAPMLGLLGTVSGLVSVFGTLGGDIAEVSDPKQLARGIAEALNSTIAGLAVAIPTVVAYSYFNKKIERLAVRMEVIMSHVIGVLYRSPSGPEIDVALTGSGGANLTATPTGSSSEEPASLPGPPATGHGLPDLPS